ncbi:MAG: hypothetical protein RL220_812 [Bacteroidota bacterium]
MASQCAANGGVVYFSYRLHNIRESTGGGFYIKDIRPGGYPYSISENPLFPVRDGDSVEIKLT